MDANMLDARIRAIFAKTHTIALVGASPKPQRASHQVMAYLQAQGYRVLPVNPSAGADQLLGETVYPSLEAIPRSITIDLVDIFRRSEEVPAIVDQAIRIGAKAIWMQLGVLNRSAAQRAEEYGLDVVMDRCPKIDLPRLGLSR